jgi:hypothetical protein
VTLNEISETIGKEVRLAAEFSNEETFGAYHEAEEYCKALGVSVGHMCNPFPTGLAKGEFDIAKWKNLSAKDKQLLDGVIVGDFRNGPVKVYLSYEVVP